MRKLYDILTNNPTALFKYFLFSLDHTDKGASIKKLIAWVVVVCLLFLHWCLWQYQLKINNFSLWTTVYYGDIIVLGGLIGINFFQEAQIKNLENKDKPNV